MPADTGRPDTGSATTDPSVAGTSTSTDTGAPPLAIIDSVAQGGLGDIRAYGLDLHSEAVDGATLDILCPSCASTAEHHPFPSSGHSDLGNGWQDWQLELTLVDDPYVPGDTTTWGGWPGEPSPASRNTGEGTLIYSAWSGTDLVACVARGVEAADWYGICEIVDPFVDYADSSFPQ